MPRLANIKQYGHYNYVIEDPDKESGRIFIENQAHNVKDLTPRLGEFFRFTNANDQSSYTEGANWYDWPVIITHGKFGISWSDSRQSWPGGIGRWDPWLLILDYDNYTHRGAAEYDQFGKKYTWFTYPRDITGSNMRSDYWVANSMVDSASYKVNTTNSWLFPLYRREDGQWVCLDLNNDFNYIATVKPDPISFNFYLIRGPGSTTQFFIGVGDDGGGYFLEVNTNTHAYSVYKYGATDPDNNPGHTPGAVSVITNVTGGYTGIVYQLPSNIKRSQSKRKVFYSSHFNASGVLSPIRFIWNQSSGDFSFVPCSVTYPGSDTYSTYAEPPVNNNYSTGLANNWWIKPHVFTKDGTDYITFCSSEKCIHYYTNERWTNDKKRTWVTYSIGSGDNDNQLTFHSAYVWPSAADFPRGWLPTISDGYKMLVFQTGKFNAIEFNTSTGWQSYYSEPIDIRAYGQDSTGRIYAISRGSASATQTGGTADAAANQVGYNSLFVINPELGAAEVSFSTEFPTYDYTGTSINTYCEVATYSDSSSTVYTATNVRLGIVGDNIRFTSTTSNYIEFATSSTGAVQIPITVISSGTSYFTIGNAV